VLPTLAVILWAYGMYALLSFIFQRKGGTSRSQSRGHKLFRYTGVTFALGVAIFIWCCYASNRHNQQLQLSGFLGTVYAEGLSGRVDKLDYPPIKAAIQGAGEQPVYALLHPGTPVSQVEPERKLIRPRPTRIVKKRHTTAHVKSHKNTKVNKSGKHSSKKDKRAAKDRGKKRKRSAVVGSRLINAG
jgi:hypothetical protein